MLELRLLGTIEIFEDGRAVPLPRLKKAVSVLAYLAVHGSSSRAELAEAIWPDSHDEEARQSLRTALAHLRRDLGPAALRSTREEVGLGPWRTDLENVREAARKGQWAYVCACLPAALAPGIHEPWVVDGEAEFEGLAVEAALRWDEAEGSPAAFDALTKAPRQVAHQAFAHRLVQRAVALGMSDLALQAVQDYESASGAVWPEGRALVRELKLRRFPTTVGRTREIESLSRQLEQDGWVTLVGPGGIGKTHLALEILRRDVTAQFLSVRDLGDGVNLPTLLGATWHDLSRCALPGLLILDEGEAVPGLGASIVALRRLRPEIHVLLTSRIATGEPTEAVVSLGPLSEDEAYEFIASRSNAPEATLREVCRKVGGHPMALQLLAGRALPLARSKGPSPLTPVQEAIDWALSRLSREGWLRLARHVVLGGSLESGGSPEPDRELLSLGIASPEIREGGSVLVVHSMIRDRLRLQEDQRDRVLRDAWYELEALIAKGPPYHFDSGPLLNLVSALAEVDPRRYERVLGGLEWQWSTLLGELDHERLFGQVREPAKSSTWRIGAMAAARRWDYETALERLIQARKISPNESATSLDLANVLSHLARFEEAEEAYRDAHPSQGSDFIVGARIAWMAEHDDLALERGAHAIRWFRDHGPLEGLGSALHECGTVAYYSHDLTRALRLMSESVAVKRLGGHWAGLPASLEGEAMVLTAMGRPEQAHSPLAEALGRMVARGAHGEFSQALFRAAEVAFRMGRFAEARCLFDEFVERSDGRGVRHHRRKAERIREFAANLPGRPRPSFETDQALLKMVRGLSSAADPGSPRG